MTTALDGIRVIDMALMGPGPFCANLLGDLGAEIIKVREVQTSGGGRGGRPNIQSLGPPLGQRNAKGICLNLKTDVGRGVFYRLARVSDVIMEGFRPGVVKRLAVDYETVRRFNEQIVYASLSGYGQDGPYRNVVGHDVNYLSVGGFLGRNCDAKGEPVLPGTVIADFAAGGMSAAVGILAALMARERHGKGQFFDSSMTDAVVEIMGPSLQHALDSRTEVQSGADFIRGRYPWYNVYLTRDRKYISIGVFEPWFYERLCMSLGLPQYAGDQYADDEKQGEIFEAFRRAFLGKTRDEWVATLRAADTCVAPVYSLHEATEDPQVSHRMIVEVEHPVKGKVRQVGSMIKLSNTPVRYDGGWNLYPGQQTDEVLTMLGYSPAELADLREQAIVA